jgi:hypothetical protein
MHSAMGAITDRYRALSSSSASSLDLPAASRHGENEASVLTGMFAVCMATRLLCGWPVSSSTWRADREPRVWVQESLLERATEAKVPKT